MRTWSRTIRLLSKDAPHLFFGCVALLEAFSGGCLTTPRARIPADEDPSDPPTPSRQCGNAREWYAPLPWIVNLPLPILMLISHLSMFSTLYFREQRPRRPQQALQIHVEQSSRWNLIVRSIFEACCRLEPAFDDAKLHVATLPARRSSPSQHDNVSIW